MKLLSKPIDELKGHETFVIPNIWNDEKGDTTLTLNLPHASCSSNQLKNIFKDDNRLNQLIKSLKKIKFIFLIFTELQSHNLSLKTSNNYIKN